MNTKNSGLENYVTIFNFFIALATILLFFSTSLTLFLKKVQNDLSNYSTIICKHTANNIWWLLTGASCFGLWWKDQEDLYFRE